MGDDASVAERYDEVLEERRLLVSFYVPNGKRGMKQLRPLRGNALSAGQLAKRKHGCCRFHSPDPKFHCDPWPPDSLPICLTSLVTSSTRSKPQQQSRSESRSEERNHTRRMATLSASPFTGAPAEPVASFFARIGLSFFEFAPEAGDEDSRRFGRIRMAEGRASSSAGNCRTCTCARRGGRARGRRYG
jgi:hypothetical protein